MTSQIYPAQRLLILWLFYTLQSTQQNKFFSVSVHLSLYTCLKYFLLSISSAVTRLAVVKQLNLPLNIKNTGQFSHKMLTRYYNRGN